MCTTRNTRHRRRAADWYFAYPREARAQDVQAAIKELGLTVTPTKDETANKRRPTRGLCRGKRQLAQIPEIQEAKQEGGAGKGALKGAAEKAC